MASFHLAATAVWREPEPIDWCEHADVDAAQAWTREAHGAYGIEFTGIPEAPHVAGTIDHVAYDTIYVDLDGRGTARFVWPEPVPFGFDPGNAVELIERDGWHELHGAMRLAVWDERNFTSGAIPPAFGEVDLAWVELCSFPDVGPGLCGASNGNAALFGLVLPDGSELHHGRSAQVGATAIGLHGGMQLPAQGTDDCIVEAWFEGVVTAAAPAK
jgi:hypothetical protein